MFWYVYVVLGGVAKFTVVSSASREEDREEYFYALEHLGQALSQPFSGQMVAP